MRPVQEIGDELYALPPQAFTATRDGYAAEAKLAGERAAAAELAAMKRPTVSAWLVNLVALRRPDAIAQLIDLGETIRGAQGSVTPTQLRDLSAQRRKEIDKVLSLAQSLATAGAAAGAETAPSRQHLMEAESTLAAAMADDAAAQLVRSGRVVKALSYSGFGAAAAGLVTPARAPAAGTAAGDAAVDTESRRAAAGARLDEARQGLAQAISAEQEATETVDRIVSGIAELRERLEPAQRAARAARQSRIAAERELASAERRLRSVEK